VEEVKKEEPKVESLQNVLDDISAKTDTVIKETADKNVQDTVC
jgi:hypothetical protein